MFNNVYGYRHWLPDGIMRNPAGSTRIPRIQVTIQQYLNADEMGGADLLLLDVTRLCLGIKTAVGVMTKLIEHNKTIPCKANETLTTYADNQPGVVLQIYQGERRLTEGNNQLSEEINKVQDEEKRQTIQVKNDLENLA